MIHPLISICIPTYNGEQFIVEAIESALRQTYTNLEIIVSDDGSKDATLKLIEPFKETTNIPIHIYHHNPSGIGANWNHCIEKANGVYIKFLFQDDILLPNCIERMVNLALKDEKIGLVYCKRQILYSDQNKFDARWVSNYALLHNKWDKLIVSEGILNGKDYLKDRKLLDRPQNKIGEPSAVLLHKDCFKKAGYFNTAIKQDLDFEYWYRLMPFFKIGFVDEELIIFRLHEGQATQQNKKDKTNDARLLSKIILKKLFRYLHYRQKLNILKDLLKVEKR